MARKASKSKPADTAAAPEGNEGADGRITKSEAVCWVIAAGKGQPADGVAYIRDTFGLEISPTHFSAAKSTEEKKKGAITLKVKRGPKASATGDGELLAALEAIKPLAASMGADKVKRLVDLLG